MIVLQPARSVAMNTVTGGSHGSHSGPLRSSSNLTKSHGPARSGGGGGVEGTGPAGHQVLGSHYSDDVEREPLNNSVFSLDEDEQ